jgi:hypothetical protein
MSTTDTGTIHVGALSPEGIILSCLPSSALMDMRDVVSTVIMLLKPSGMSTLSLPVTVISQTAALLKIVHLWQAGEISESGRYSAYPLHSLASGGPVPGQTVFFPVLEHFQ